MKLILKCTTREDFHVQNNKADFFSRFFKKLVSDTIRYSLQLFYRTFLHIITQKRKGHYDFQMFIRIIRKMVNMLSEVSRCKAITRFSIPNITKFWMRIIPHYFRINMSNKYVIVNHHK